jgi:hypothetical protein
MADDNILLIPYVGHYNYVKFLSIDLFIYESGPKDEKIKDVLFMQTAIRYLTEAGA